MKKTSRLKQRLDRLEGHLQDENPDLVQAVHALRDMDDVAHRMGLLPDGESYANKLSWWPLISVLGTFSAGKSSFINTFLGQDLQKTGNQAIDDHFTVITYSRGAESQTLPGQALDSDPRFPFYRISEELHEVIPGEGEKIDHYLQMKVVPSEVVKGKILIDSPGFDADEQRKSVLEITEHIIGLSDLVLVFFDGRHPEVGAMRDTLSHLVSPARDLKDADKFLFILNQVDTSAREDNLEEVVAAWRSALSSHGLSTGNFFVHYNERLATPVADEKVWARFQSKRDADYEEISKRIRNLDTHRTYRIVGKLKPLANDIENKAVPKLREAIDEWRKNVLVTDMIAFAIIAFVALLFMNAADKYLEKSDILFWVMTAGILGGLTVAHFSARTFFSKRIAATLKEESYGDMDRAFLKNTAGWRSIFFSNPTGFSGRSHAILEKIRDKSEAMIVALNTKMANPSGKNQQRSSVPSYKKASVQKQVDAPSPGSRQSPVAQQTSAPQPMNKSVSAPVAKQVVSPAAVSAPTISQEVTVQTEIKSQAVEPAPQVAPKVTPHNSNPFLSSSSAAGATVASAAAAIASRAQQHNDEVSLFHDKVEIIDVEINEAALSPNVPVIVSQEGKGGSPKSSTASVPPVSGSKTGKTAPRSGDKTTASPKSNLSMVKKKTEIVKSLEASKKVEVQNKESHLSSALTKSNVDKANFEEKENPVRKPVGTASKLPLTKPLKKAEGLDKKVVIGSSSKANGAEKSENKG